MAACPVSGCSGAPMLTMSPGDAVALAGIAGYLHGYVGNATAPSGLREQSAQLDAIVTRLKASAVRDAAPPVLTEEERIAAVRLIDRLTLQLTWATNNHKWESDIMHEWFTLTAELRQLRHRLTGGEGGPDNV